MEDQKGQGGAPAATVFDVFAQSDAETPLTVVESEQGKVIESTTDQDTPGDDKAAEKGPYDFLDDAEEEVKDDDGAVDQGKKVVEQGNSSAAEIKSLMEAQLLKSLGQAITLPDDTNEENVAVKLMELGRKNLHPEALRLQNAIESGMDPKSYYESYSQYDQALALPDTELVKRNLIARLGKTDDRPDGLEDAKIAERVARMNQDDLEDRAVEIRQHIRQQKALRDQQLSENSVRQQGPDPSSPEFKETFNKGFTEVFDEVMKDDVYGLKFVTPEKQKAAAARLQEVLYPDAKTRQNKFVQALQDPKQAMKIAMLWDMAESGFLRLNAQKNAASTKRQLGDLLNKRNSSGASQRAGDQKTDFAVFSQPEG
jgi:hypothetical protein